MFKIPTYIMQFGSALPVAVSY